ncbi:MAG: hypothetical protein JKY13_00595 [Gammaproteobacteria bacterium]|nr:hypothetical protein [Gammaproteobacteria bacterium]
MSGLKAVKINENDNVESYQVGEKEFYIPTSIGHDDFAIVGKKDANLDNTEFTVYVNPKHFAQDGFNDKQNTDIQKKTDALVTKTLEDVEKAIEGGKITIVFGTKNGQTGELTGKAVVREIRKNSISAQFVADGSEKITYKNGTKAYEVKVGGYGF